MAFGPRRAQYLDARELVGRARRSTRRRSTHLETFDRVYRSLVRDACTTTCRSPGHPGGSISSGRFVQALLFDALDYDLVAARPRMTRTSSRTRRATRRSACTRCGRCATRSPASPRRSCSPRTRREQLRLEDLLGFRRNPDHGDAALQRSSTRKALDGHPTPGDAVRAALDRRLGRRPAGLARPRLRRRGPLRRGRAARPHRRGRGRDDARPRRRGDGRRGHGVARQRRAARRLEPGFHRLQPRLPRRRDARATTCSGIPPSSPTSTTGT